MNQKRTLWFALCMDILWSLLYCWYIGFVYTVMQCNNSYILCKIYIISRWFLTDYQYIQIGIYKYRYNVYKYFIMNSEEIIWVCVCTWKSYKICTVYFFWVKIVLPNIYVNNNNNKIDIKIKFTFLLGWSNFSTSFIRYCNIFYDLFIYFL